MLDTRNVAELCRTQSTNQRRHRDPLSSWRVFHGDQGHARGEHHLQTDQYNWKLASMTGKRSRVSCIAGMVSLFPSPVISTLQSPHIPCRNIPVVPHIRIERGGSDGSLPACHLPSKYLPVSCPLLGMVRCRRMACTQVLFLRKAELGFFHFCGKCDSDRLAGTFRWSEDPSTTWLLPSTAEDPAGDDAL